MASVVIRDVRKAFGLTPVIHGVTITIDDGQFVVLVGPSGCGKSTLLRMIAGLENITAGEIQIGDRVVNNLLPKERDVAMVFQNYALYPHMTVAANMAFSMKLRGAPMDEIEKRVMRAAEILGLAQLLERYPRALPWAAEWCWIRRYFFSTSRCRTSTPSGACRCAPRSRNFISASRPR